VWRRVRSGGRAPQHIGGSKGHELLTIAPSSCAVNP
jgi:hypothetical protein